MGKLYNFLLGVVVGFGVYHAASHYHLIHAKDGYHVVEKVPARLEEVYVDVRNYNTQQWIEHPELAIAIENAGKRDILTQAAKDSVNELLDKVHPPSE